MLAVGGTYQNCQLLLQEQVPFTQLVTVIVTFLEEVDHKIPSSPINSSIADNKLLGLFAHETELIDEITELAMQARENSSLRCSDG